MGNVWPKDAKHWLEDQESKLCKKFNANNYEMKVPDYYWKVIATPKRGHAAFYIPNTQQARTSKSKAKNADGVEKALAGLEQFMVSVNHLEQLLRDDTREIS